jgi:hypothetical protein
MGTHIDERAHTGAEVIYATLSTLSSPSLADLLDHATEKCVHR